MDLMPMLGKVDAICTDPPYGINLDVSLYTTKSGKKHNKFNKIKNDDCVPILPIKYIFNLDLPTVMFGTNNFPELLPHRGKTIVWDKRVTEAADGLRGSPVELAWENRVSGYDRIIRVQHGGVINADSMNGNSEPRFHPTQKPVKLMQAILKFKPYIDCQTILDPFMGSGTTGVACVKLGRKFIGIELDEGYFDIACRRIEEAYKQPDLFIDPPKIITQEKMI
jgi:site-specific DNA-methyltransferase (adenine-specific)/modification methylase